jgi:hypothetical protein
MHIVDQPAHTKEACLGARPSVGGTQGFEKSPTKEE